MKKGISVMSLIAAVTIIMILLTTVTVSGINTAHNAKKIAFGAEIKMIQGAVDAYYTENNATYPIKDKAYSIEINDDVSKKNRMIFNSNEGEGISSFTVYAIDYDLIGVKNLIYGKPKDKDENDIYVVSRKSGKVYYLKGLKIGSETYYTVTDDIENLLSYNSEKNTVNSPIIKFEPSTTEWTSDNIEIGVNLPSDCKVISSMYNDKSVSLDNLKVEENGTLIIKYYEEKEQSKIKEAKYIVSNIDKEGPEVTIDEDKLVELKSGNDIGYIYIKSKSDDLSGIKYFKYDYGDFTDFDNAKKHFHASGIDVKEDIIFFRSFTEDITIYAEDNAGNVNIQKITPYGDIIKIEDPSIPADASIYPVVPKGFTKVNTSIGGWNVTSEQVTLNGKTYYKAKGWNDGLVIQDDLGNQFVWVPVEIDDEYKNGISSDPLNISLTKFKRSSSVYEEPFANALRDTTEKNSYRTMITSVVNYGGFYVGRYKAKGASNATVENLKITKDGTEYAARFTEYTYTSNADMNLVEWTLVDSLSKISGEQKQYNYSLILGIQWDRMVEWLGSNSNNIEELRTGSAEWTREVENSITDSSVGISGGYKIITRGGQTDLTNRAPKFPILPDYINLQEVPHPTGAVRVTLNLNI